MQPPQTSSLPGPSADVNETSSLLHKASSNLSRDPPVDEETLDVGPNVPHSDVRGLAMLARLEFWQLFLIMALLSGIGLMTIKYVFTIDRVTCVWLLTFFFYSNIGNSV